MQRSRDGADVKEGRGRHRRNKRYPNVEDFDGIVGSKWKSFGKERPVLQRGEWHWSDGDIARGYKNASTQVLRGSMFQTKMISDTSRENRRGGTQMFRKRGYKSEGCIVKELSANKSTLREEGARNGGCESLNKGVELRRVR